jgi:hypothetical protein
MRPFIFGDFYINNKKAVLGALVHTPNTASIF